MNGRLVPRSKTAEEGDTYGTHQDPSFSRPMNAGRKAHLVRQATKGKSPLASLVTLALLSTSKTAAAACAGFAFEMDRLLEKR